MKKPDWIDLMSNAPAKERKGYWIFDILPCVTMANDDQGPVLGIGWLFWTLVIYFPKWE